MKLLQSIIAYGVITSLFSEQVLADASLIYVRDKIKQAEQKVCDYHSRVIKETNEFFEEDLPRETRRVKDDISQCIENKIVTSRQSCNMVKGLCKYVTQRKNKKLQSIVRESTEEENNTNTQNVPKSIADLIDNMHIIGKSKFVQGPYLPHGGLLIYYQEEDVVIGTNHYDRLDIGYLNPIENPQINPALVIASTNIDYKKTPFGKIPKRVTSYAMIDGGIFGSADGVIDRYAHESFNLAELIVYWLKVQNGEGEGVKNQAIQLIHDPDDKVWDMFNCVQTYVRNCSHMKRIATEKKKNIDYNSN